MFGGKEEEEDGDGDDIMVVVVVGMEEEMEEKKVEEFVELMVVKKLEKMGCDGRPRSLGCCFSLVAVGRKRKKERNHERERVWEWVFLYVRQSLLLPFCPPFKSKETQEWRLASPCN